MTYEPPPPPPGSPVPPPVGAGSRAGSFDPRSVHNLDWAILAIGFLVFIFSFFAYYTWDAGEIMGMKLGSVTRNAWHFSDGTFLAWFAMAFSVLAAAALAVELFVPTVRLPVPARQAGVLGFAAGFVLYVIAIFAHSDFGPYFSHGFSFWFSLVLAAVGAVISLARAQQTGTPLPGPLNNLPTIGR